MSITNCAEIEGCKRDQKDNLQIQINMLQEIKEQP